MDELEDIGGDSGMGGDFGGGYLDGIGGDVGDSTLSDTAPPDDTTDQIDNASGPDDSFTDNGDGTFTDADGNIVDQEGNALTDNGDGTYSYTDPGQAAAATATPSQGQSISVGGGGSKDPKGSGGSPSQKPAGSSTSAKPQAQPAKQPATRFTIGQGIQRRRPGDQFASIYRTAPRGSPDPNVVNTGYPFAGTPRVAYGNQIGASMNGMDMTPFLVLGGIVLLVLVLKK